MSDTTSLELKQKYLSERRHFYLEPKRIRIVVKNLNGEKESYIGYESISPTKRTVRIRKGSALIMAVVFCFIAVLVLFFGFLSTDSGLISFGIIAGISSFFLFSLYLLSKRNYYVVDLYNNNLRKNKSLFFLEGRPSPEGLASFIESLYEARRDCLRNKYLDFDPDDAPELQLGRAKWLLKEELISEDEFQELRQLLKSSKGAHLGFV